MDTPAALIDTLKMQRNIQRMQLRAESLGVHLRPHVKTHKCAEVVAAQIAAGARGITVSTLKEAEYFFERGIHDILYAVAMAPHKLPQALALQRQGCALTLITDSLAGAQAIVDFGRQHGETFAVMIEIDCDGHRCGVKPQSPELLVIAQLLGANLAGVLTHAGESYGLDTPEALQAIAEQERARCVEAAERIRAAGLSCEQVSVGSTPTALSALSLHGVTELRAGVYAFFDLVMHNIGVCRADELALSVLTTVIGHQAEKGWVITDAGWMAMSRDRGTQSQKRDFGYGQVCDEYGEPSMGCCSAAPIRNTVWRGLSTAMWMWSRTSHSARACAFCPTMRARRARSLVATSPFRMTLMCRFGSACAAGSPPFKHRWLNAEGGLSRRRITLPEKPAPS